MINMREISIHFPNFIGTTNVHKCRNRHLRSRPLRLTSKQKHINVARHESFRKHRIQTVILFLFQCLLMSVLAHHKKDDDDDNDHRGGNRFVLRRQRLLGWPPFIPHTLGLSSTLPPVSDQVLVCICPSADFRQLLCRIRKIKNHFQGGSALCRHNACPSFLHFFPPFLAMEKCFRKVGKKLGRGQHKAALIF